MFVSISIDMISEKVTITGKIKDGATNPNNEK